ncbi:hypothetical protein [Spirosoma montaniterrae]|uniref:Uncharacterized protein n=1 Tax=Spirosoma montaniterrae TaxID=1178516 RepID=A0A1P9X018_9BACT|nr:hypothetical protein [Spirosoma montaniterrae]AQG80954.1 hypothetical protein AWR27_17465 [Spirosoma montaniterrae]
MNQVQHYLTRYKQAATLEEKEAVVADYQLYLQTLTPEERDKAREVMGVLWPSIKQRIDELTPMMDSLTKMLDRLTTPTIKA